MNNNDSQSVQAAKQRVLDTIEALKDQMIGTLSEVVKIPSVNPKYPGQVYDEQVGHEGEVNEIIAGLFRDAGAEVEMITREPGRANAAGRISGSGGGKTLVMNGHVDVVPPNRADLWDRDPFSGEIDDERVYGRGTTDDKGGVVAMTFAALALKQANIKLQGDLVLQSVVGEEVGDHVAGTSAVLEEGYVGDAAIVCEPTNFGEENPNIVPVTPGMLWWTIELEGLAAHSGLRGLTIHPTLEGESLGVNVIDKYWVIYQALRQLEDEWAQTNRHPLFKPGYFSIQPGVMKAHPYGVEVPFFLADQAVIEYCSYHHPDRSNEEVIEEVEETIKRACGNDPWLRAHPPKLTWQLKWAPYTAPENFDLVDSIRAAYGDVTGQDLIAEGFLGVCDLTWMKEVGLDGVCYGPGVGRTAHAVNEYVMIEQMVVAAKTYALTAIDYCGLDEAATSSS